MSSPELPSLPTIIPAPTNPSVRIFSDPAIQQHLAEALLGADDKSRFAVVAHADLQKFVAVARYEDGPWTIAGYIEKDWTGPLTAGAELRFEI